MNAVWVEGFGGPERLAWREAPTPEPGDGEVLLRLAACGLNFSDLLMRQGDYLGGPRPPFQPGMEAAGVIAAVGEGSPLLLDGTPATAGQRVAVVGAGGLQASHAVAPAASCIALPDGLAFETAAALPVSYLTAYHALVTVGRAAPGETVLIHAAAGGFGSAAVQVARHLGLTVIGTASTAAKRDRVTTLGAIATADYSGFERTVRELTAGRGPDLILETIGGDVLRRGLRLLPPLGRLVLIGMSSQQVQPLDSVRLLFKSQAILGFHLSAVLARRDLLAPSLAQLLSWVAAGDLAVQVGHTLKLSEIREAHRLLASRQSVGKIVLLP